MKLTPISRKEFVSGDVETHVTVTHKEPSQEPSKTEELPIKSQRVPLKEYSWLVDGLHYSKSKRRLKAVYAKHGLEWAGNFFTNNFIWRNKKTEEEVRNTYERDEAKDQTKRVTITAKVSNTQLLAEMAAIIIPGIVEETVDEKIAELEGKFLGRLENVKRDVDRGKIGAEAFYRIMKADYEEQRSKLLCD